MREQVSVRVARALAVLAVLAGVMAMHGLATVHHGATATPVLRAVVAAVHADGHAHAPLAAQAAGVDEHDCDLLCQGNEHALALLCFAVLLAAASGVLVLRQPTGLLPRRTGPPSRPLLRTAAPPRSGDLVAELCVSRT